MISVRPKIAELVFRVYSRPLHPELFQVCQRETICRGDYEARIEITTAGHLVTWRSAGLTLTEVATAAHHPLPQRRSLKSYRLRGQRSDCIQCRGNVRYEMSFQLERAEPEIFWTCQQDLLGCGQHQGLLHRFGTNGRMATGAMSCVHFQARDRSLLVQSFHTFPEDYAIVKSQSVFQLP